MSNTPKKPEPRKPVPFDVVVKRLLDTPPPHPTKGKSAKRKRAQKR